MNKIALFILVALALCFLSCNNEKRTNSEVAEYALGKYIYRDDNDIHHVNSNCPKLRHGKDDNGHDIYAMHPMDTANFAIINSEYFRVCSRCVTQKQYERILKISERNSQ